MKLRNTTMRSRGATARVTVFLWRLSKFFFVAPMVLAFVLTARGQERLMLDRAVATVNGEIVTLSETREAAWDATGQTGALSEEDSRRLAKALDDVIARRLLIQGAEAMKIEPDREEIDREVADSLKNLQRQFPNNSAFEQFLSERGLSVEVLREMIRKRESETQVIRRAVARRVHITDAETKAYEEQMKAKGEEPVHYLLDHIFFALPENPPTTEEERVRLEAADVATRIQRGEEFERFCKLYSDDAATADKGGSLGWVARGSLQPALLTAVEQLDNGQTSPPVRGGQGFHVLRLRAKRDAYSLLFEKKAIESRKQWLDELRRKADIKYFPYDRDKAANTTGTAVREP